MSRDPFPNARKGFDRDDQKSVLEPSEPSISARHVSADDVSDGEPESPASMDARRGPETNDSLRAFYLRDRSYLLREAEFTTLVEVGKFRVVDATDLVQFAYAGDTGRMNRDIRRLEQQGLIARKLLGNEGKGAQRLLVLTGKAKRLVLQSGCLPQGQTIYHGLVKPREAQHDAALYRLYQQESARIERAGGRAVRVALDYELKRNLNRELAEPENRGQAREKRERVAEKHGLVLIGDKVQIPDVRLEYETADHEPRHIDLELATRNYRPRALAQKAKAGFSIYAPREDASKLRRILAETEQPARIYSL
jgi:hypothetical protein